MLAKIDLKLSIGLFVLLSVASCVFYLISIQLGSTVYYSIRAAVTLMIVIIMGLLGLSFVIFAKTSDPETSEIMEGFMASSIPVIIIATLLLVVSLTVLS